MPALIGRTFTARDDVRGGGPDGPVAVISYGMWQRRFGGDANVIGTSLVIERIPFTIIGVTPPEFFGAEVGRTFDVAVPLNAQRLIRGKDSDIDTGMVWLYIMVRLKARTVGRGGNQSAALGGAARSARPRTSRPPRCRRVPAALSIHARSGVPGHIATASTIRAAPS